MKYKMFLSVMCLFGLIGVAFGNDVNKPDIRHYAISYSNQAGKLLQNSYDLFVKAHELSVKVQELKRKSLEAKAAAKKNKSKRKIKAQYLADAEDFKAKAMKGIADIKGLRDRANHVREQAKAKLLEFFKKEEELGKLNKFEYILQLSCVLMELEEYELLISMIESRMQIALGKPVGNNAQYADAHLFLGFAYIWTGKETEAKEHFHKVLAYESRKEEEDYYPRTYANLGMSYLAASKKNWKDARKYQEAAKKAHPLTEGKITLYFSPRGREGYYPWDVCCTLSRCAENCQKGYFLKSYLAAKKYSDVAKLVADIPKGTLCSTLSKEFESAESKKKVRKYLDS